MMKGIYSDPNYRAISVIALLQICVVAGGVLSVCGIMKLCGYGTVPDDHFREPALFVRRYGLTIFALPTIWAFTGILMVRRFDEEGVHRVWRWFGVLAVVVGLAAFAGLAFQPTALH